MGKTNIQKLSEYINAQTDPTLFMNILLTLCKPSPDNLPDRNQEPKV
jgi:hypothetical protein